MDLPPWLVEHAMARAGLDRPARLSDGTLGYRMAHDREDDCFRAAVATVLQVAPERIPDSRIDAQLAAGNSAEYVSRAAWRQLEEWLTERGLRMVVHHRPPVRCARWIGIVRFPGEFEDHSLVMAGDSILWDPADLVPGLRRNTFTVRSYEGHEVSMGYSFTSI
jgi:hypothetical protein